MCWGGEGRGLRGRGEGAAPPPQWAQHIGRATATRDGDRRSGRGARGPHRGGERGWAVPPPPPQTGPCPPPSGLRCPPGLGHVGCFKTLPARPRHGHAWAERGGAWGGAGITGVARPAASTAPTWALRGTAGTRRGCGAAGPPRWHGASIARRCVAAAQPPHGAATARSPHALCTRCTAGESQQRSAARPLHACCSGAALPWRGPPPPPAPCPHPKANGEAWRWGTRGAVGSGSGLCGAAEGVAFLPSPFPPPPMQALAFPTSPIAQPRAGGLRPVGPPCWGGAWGGT